MDKIFQIATNISTPLMLAGFFAAAFFFVARQIIKANIFPKLSRQLSGDIIKIIIERLFILALVAMIFGFIGYIIGEINPKKEVSEKVKEYYASPSSDLIKLSLEDITAVDFAPKPTTKNLTFNFKVVPKSKDKFVPLKAKGQLILIDTSGYEKSYSFDVNLDEEGIKPQVVSHITLDGLIPMQDFKNISGFNNYRARCIFFYDSDVMPTDLKFITDMFQLDRSTIKDLSQ
jgi:hypothetical protein